MTDPINQDLEILKREVKSAEALNTLHGCTAGHPWCEGKTMNERVMGIRCIMAGRTLSADGHNALRRIERHG